MRKILWTCSLGNDGFWTQRSEKILMSKSGEFEFVIRFLELCQTDQNHNIRWRVSAMIYGQLIDADFGSL